MMLLHLEGLVGQELVEVVPDSVWSSAEKRVHAGC